MPLRDTRLNTLDEMLVRFVFAVRLFLFFGGLIALVFAVSERSLWALWQAVGLFSLMIAGHRWLKARGKLEECERAFEGMMRAEDVTDDAIGLEALLERRAVLEQRRGQPGFDPWEVQAVRREINAYMREHPEAKRELDRLM